MALTKNENGTWLTSACLLTRFGAKVCAGTNWTPWADPNGWEPDPSPWVTLMKFLAQIHAAAVTESWHLGAQPQNSSAGPITEGLRDLPRLST